MSDINNIKPLGQAELASSRSSSTPARDNSKGFTSNAASDQSNRSDTVSLTNVAEQLQSVQQIIAETPDVDTDRVSALRAAIEDGSYLVDVDKLAQNLLSSENELR